MASTSKTREELINPDEFISIEHKDVKPAEGREAPRVSREYFEMDLKGKGWTEIKDSASPDPTPGAGAAPTSNTPS